MLCPGGRNGLIEDNTKQDALSRREKWLIEDNTEHTELKFFHVINKKVSLQKTQSTLHSRSGRLHISK